MIHQLRSVSANPARISGMIGPDFPPSPKEGNGSLSASACSALRARVTLSVVWYWLYGAMMASLGMLGGSSPPSSS